MSTASTTPVLPSNLNPTLRCSPSENYSSASSTMSTPTPPPAPASIAVPMGFAGQLKAMQDAQRNQEDRIVALEKENDDLKTSQADIQVLMNRITTLEQHNAHLADRRREAVSQLLNLRTLHQEASNTFHLRSQDIQPNDLEGMIGVYANSVTTVMNHHQRVLGQLRANGQLSNYILQGAYGTCVPTPMHMHPQQGRSLYPMAYNEAGFCRTHGAPYRCRICGQ
jgi:hypothetical protein